MAVHKLRTNRQLTQTDLEELERMLRESGTGTAEDVEKAKADAEGSACSSVRWSGWTGGGEGGLRGLPGRAALTANQMEFVGMVVDHLTENGVMDAGKLYASPYTDLSPLGVDGIFAPGAVDDLIGVLSVVRSRAAA